MAIRIYITVSCGDCSRAKRFLEDKGVEFEEINIEEDEQAAQLVMDNNGGKRRVPTIEIDGSYYGNPTLRQLADLLANY